MHPCLNWLCLQFHSSLRSLFNIHLIYPLFLSPLCPCLSLRWCASFPHQGSLPSLSPVLIHPAGSELRARIIEGFEPSSFCSYYPSAFAISAPAHPSHFLSAPLTPIDLAGRLSFTLLLLLHSCPHSFLKRFPRSFISNYLFGLPFKKHMKIKDVTFLLGQKLWRLLTSFAAHSLRAVRGCPYSDTRWYDRRKPPGECDKSEEARSHDWLKDDWQDRIFLSLFVS